MFTLTPILDSNWKPAFELVKTETGDKLTLYDADMFNWTVNELGLRYRVIVRIERANPQVTQSGA